MKKSIKLFISATAIITVSISVGIFFSQQSTAKIPIPKIAMTGSDEVAEYEFSSTFDLPVENSVDLYTIETDSPEKLIEKVETIFDIDNIRDSFDGDLNSPDNYYFLDEQDLTITINDKNGNWVATKNDSEYEGHDGPVMPQNLPSEEKAIDIATSYIIENQLFDGDLGEPIVGYSYTGDVFLSDDQLLDRRVTFVPPIDRKKVSGIYRITIVIADNGTIHDVFKQASPVKISQLVQLKTEEQVVYEVQSHPENLSSTATGIDRGMITGCELHYYVDGETIDGKNYAYPVYVLTGEGETVQDKLSRTAKPEIKEFDIVIDAIKR